MARFVSIRILPVLLLAGTALSPAPAPGHAGAATADLAHYVDPFIGTGIGGPDYGIGNEGGHVFPGAGYPHGMVQWSPDTTALAGGYRYQQAVIHGFSLTHFSGRGCASYQDIPFMPVAGPITASPAGSARYWSGFDHGHEAASPGYYRVLLHNGVQVELTATARTGIGRFTFPAGGAQALLIDAGGSATGNDDQGTGIAIAGPALIMGSAASGHFCGSANQYRVFFAATFNRPFSGYGTWNGAALAPGSRSSAGSHAGAYVSFDADRSATMLAKVGVSFVSVDNALANLAAEDPGWAFASVQARARAAWNARLDAIGVQGGSTAERTIFYTALYHTLFHPNVFSDANGQYLGFDGKVHVARGYVQYENFPGWDMYRSLIGLRALLEPRETGDMLQSLVEDAAQGGGGLPRWEVANDNSGGMVGDSQDIVIATSYALGVRGFDARAALRAMLRGASDPSARSGRYPPREGLAEYLARGYVPDTLRGSASITLEYAADDFAIAQFADALGERALAAAYLARSRGWRALFNSATGYIEPRGADGAFPARFSPVSRDGYVEGDAAQYRWLVPFNLPGLFRLLGGDGAAVRQLDAHFVQLNAGTASPYAFMGNEPELAVPWEYDYAGAPWRTQAVVRRIERALFHATPGGLPGNDDGGALSSWYVFAALGLYPEVPGVGGFALGSPLFPHAVVHLGNGRSLVIDGVGAGQDAPYVHGLSLDGAPLTSPWLEYARLAVGGHLTFALGMTPDSGWGSGPIAGGPGR